MSGPTEGGDEDGWRLFAVAHGGGSRAADVARALGRTEAEVRRLRRSGARGDGARLGFAGLFRLWHGREPDDSDWPPPPRSGRDGYGWQPPELAALAGLVGRLEASGIAQVLTARLRQATGDPAAERTPSAVQLAINRIGMQSGDVVGGITIAAAGREAGSRATVEHAIRTGVLQGRRVGRLWVIPHEAWAGWKALRSAPPEGYVALASLRGPLSVRSDKLSEFARLGAIPTAVRCSPFGTSLANTRHGTWYIEPAAAARLVADRRAGLPMPWHGIPLMENLKATWRLLQARRHPASCAACAAIWGPRGAPTEFGDYAVRYPPIGRGAKRHLTRPWDGPPRTAPSRTAPKPRGAPEPRAAAAGGHAGARWWEPVPAPRPARMNRWIAVPTAAGRHGFTEDEVRRMAADGTVASRVGTDGAQRGVELVDRTDCTAARERAGFTLEEAARRAGIPAARMTEMMDGLDWRGTGAIPLATVRAVIKRVQARPGRTVAEAAAELGRDEAWVRARIEDGTVRPGRRVWQGGKPYLSDPMMERLRAAPDARAAAPAGMRLSGAAADAGVSAATLIGWAEEGGVARTYAPSGWRYDRDAVRARARLYWREPRSHRATAPGWLRDEDAAEG